MIFHIPHASINIPREHRPPVVLNSSHLSRELLKMTDWFTDDLFGSHAGPRDTILVYPVSRLVVDPERLIDDHHEPMAQVGMGVVYTKTSDGNALRLPPTEEEREAFLDAYYRPHHQRLADAVDAELKREGRAVILDCHSFPSNPLSCEPDQNPERPDICIGTDEYHTPGSLLKAVEEQCQAEGLSFAVNRPFAGCIVPMANYRQNRNVCSIMLEVNRRLYLDEKTGKKSGSFENCRSSVGRLIQAVRRGWAIAEDNPIKDFHGLP
jgi:N-formylglutamate amidohydrolase